MGGPLRLWLGGIPSPRGWLLSCHSTVCKAQLAASEKPSGSMASTKEASSESKCFRTSFTTLALMMKWCIWCSRHPSCSFS